MKNVYMPIIAKKKKTIWKIKKKKIIREKESGKSIFVTCVEHEKLTVIDTDFNVD